MALDISEGMALPDLMNEMINISKEQKIIRDSYYDSSIIESSQKTLEKQAQSPVFQCLLDERNKNWVSFLTDYLNGDPIFIAVGAGHLHSPGSSRSVVDLLKDKGFTVTKL